jgi:hypothetical protein
MAHGVVEECDLIVQRQSAQRRRLFLDRLETLYCLATFLRLVHECQIERHEIGGRR